MSTNLMEKILRFHARRQSGGRSPSSSGSESGESNARVPGAVPASSPVCRRLFDGQPNPEENIQFAREQLARERREAARRWNFDFENDRPHEGRFEWRREIIALPYRRPSPNPPVPVRVSTAAEGETVTVSSRTLRSRENSPVSQISHLPVISKPVNPGKDIQNASEDCDKTSRPTTSLSGANETSEVQTTDGPNLLPCGASKSSHSSKPIPRQTSMTDHFMLQKGSRSKVKVQERKSNTSENLSREKSEERSSPSPPMCVRGAGSHSAASE
ncbi:hypothetical protein TCAL_09120 [Tigriopus californicus]|uniref:Cyclin-dependent kinase inhibitor domain-containing protein n=1 Tax=Tigriopus californicus TaxID=6832 RepID=A0A553P7Y9_TIGCA|nr:cyclin-dependent kinase inhibitor 1B-like [Tigriopus californicus]TRY73801.1 hypothetical protein TCAL_09120 [Tigriopus californicus]|eukprot:TCALIF_09120-PA protein Name:"Similar to Cdkn1b Cyclin-dependent kinase inhibitor 1B (Mus musculus)" AED:0.00 eAED:0.00 QI:53/1/1/1/1/1/2/619/271